eukprot:GHVQ01036885.1.p1 GENE.GHVQ01036885.1~~GHVQ01036885.1.p1  ORF type:complete len:925 (+),score=86.92 GHVQ01036885.1:595-3369(+)
MTSSVKAEEVSVTSESVCTHVLPVPTLHTQTLPTNTSSPDILAPDALHSHALPSQTSPTHSETPTATPVPLVDELPPSAISCSSHAFSTITASQDGTAAQGTLSDASTSVSLAPEEQTETTSHKPLSHGSPDILTMQIPEFLLPVFHSLHVPSSRQAEILAVFNHSDIYTVGTLALYTSSFQDLTALLPNLTPVVYRTIYDRLSEITATCAKNGNVLHLGDGVLQPLGVNAKSTVSSLLREQAPACYQDCPSWPPSADFCFDSCACQSNCSPPGYLNTTPVSTASTSVPDSRLSSQTPSPNVESPSPPRRQSGPAHTSCECCNGSCNTALTTSSLSNQSPVLQPPACSTNTSSSTPHQQPYGNKCSSCPSCISPRAVVPDCGYCCSDRVVEQACCHAFCSTCGTACSCRFPTCSRDCNVCPYQSQRSFHACCAVPPAGSSPASAMSFEDFFSKLSTPTPPRVDETPPHLGYRDYLDGGRYGPLPMSDDSANSSGSQSSRSSLTRAFPTDSFSKHSSSKNFSDEASSANRSRQLDPNASKKTLSRRFFPPSQGPIPQSQRRALPTSQKNTVKKIVENIQKDDPVEEIEGVSVCWDYSDLQWRAKLRIKGIAEVQQFTRPPVEYTKAGLLEARRLLMARVHQHIHDTQSFPSSSAKKILKPIKSSVPRTSVPLVLGPSGYPATSSPVLTASSTTSIPSTSGIINIDANSGVVSNKRKRNEYDFWTEEGTLSAYASTDQECLAVPDPKSLKSMCGSDVCLYTTSQRRAMPKQFKEQVQTLAEEVKADVMKTVGSRFWHCRWEFRDMQWRGCLKTSRSTIHFTRAPYDMSRVFLRAAIEHVVNRIENKHRELHSSSIGGDSNAASASDRSCKIEADVKEPEAIDVKEPTSSIDVVKDPGTLDPLTSCGVDEDTQHEVTVEASNSIGDF